VLHLPAGLAVDEKLLVADAVTVVIQINGKIKDRIDVAPTISDADLEAAALALPSIVEALAGATVAIRSSPAHQSL